VRRHCYICRQPRERLELVELGRCPLCGAEPFLCLDCDARPPNARAVAFEAWRSNHVCPQDSAAHLMMAAGRIKRAVNDLHEARHLLDACGLYEESNTVSLAIVPADNVRERVRNAANRSVH
jgi:hypothetical protein